MKRPKATVGVLLAGAGVHDGTDVLEASFALLAIEHARAIARFIAPDVPQAHVVDHQQGAVAQRDERNVRVEAARIARGPVQALTTVDLREFDALLVPGGYGVTKNLCDYAFRGRTMTVQPDVERLVRDAFKAKKPMAFLCTAPLIAARVLSDRHPVVTLGRDVAMADDVAAWGAVHQACDARNIVVDRDHRIVSTPAFGVSSSLDDIAYGIDRAVRALLELVG